VKQNYATISRDPLKEARTWIEHQKEAKQDIPVINYHDRVYQIKGKKIIFSLKGSKTPSEISMNNIEHVKLPVPEGYMIDKVVIYKKDKDKCLY